jgi:cysteine-rich repeat protein
MRTSLWFWFGSVTAALLFFGCDDNGNGNGSADMAHGSSGGDMAAMCGNGRTDPGEDCDTGAANGTGSCTAQCTWSCTESAGCDDGKVCNGVEQCQDHVCAAGVAAGDGTSCGNGMQCRAGSCVSSGCGDGVVSGTEECDDGNQVDGDGCNNDCKLSCVPTDATRNCTPADACAGQGTCNLSTHVCAAGTPLPDGSACGSGKDYCRGGSCTTPACGNSIVDPGEQCDDGALNGTSSDGCTATCAFVCVNPATDCSASPPPCQKLGCATDHTCTAIADSSQNGSACDVSKPDFVCKDGACSSPDVVCGDGVRAGGEQCDDGNTLNLDGCDSQCRFEQIQRLTALKMQFATDAVCANNALGAAITPAAQEIIQQTFDIPVQSGDISVVIKFLGLTDLSGANDSFRLGFVYAAPVAGTNYDGTNDLDWWYVRDPVSVDSSETPLSQLAATVSGGSMTAGPWTIRLRLQFALSPADVTLYNAKVLSTIGSAQSTPTVSSSGMTPGHLASENLLPSLQSFTAVSAGTMCAQVSASSLNDVAMPMLLQQVCTRADGSTPAFTADNRLVDAFVTGCLIFGTPAILATQPDLSLDGSTYAFAADQNNRLTSCTKDGITAPLADCLAAATYSSYFAFTSDRVIVHRN